MTIEIPGGLRDVHVAPLPPNHVASPSCSCEPIQSITVAGAVVYVHRTEPIPLPVHPELRGLER